MPFDRHDIAIKLKWLVKRLLSIVGQVSLAAEQDFSLTRIDWRPDKVFA